MIDLHTHSVCSDGSETPARVVGLAAAAGCAAVALTDHDGLDGLAEARSAAAAHGIELVPGCEVSCGLGAISVHLLCYFIEPAGEPFAAELERLRRDREERNERLRARLDDLGMPLSAKELSEQAGTGTVGRPHFAALLVKKGFATSAEDAFERLLGEGGLAYVEQPRLTVEQAVAAVRASGGASSLAHPRSLGLERAELGALLAQWQEAGLDGLECHYGGYDQDVRSELLGLAASHGLVATGGSDFHGRYSPGVSVGVGRGDLVVPDEALDALRSRRRPVAGC